MTIADYLGELERELRLRRAPRLRLIKEAEGHLRDLADQFVAGGLAREQAEAQAVAQFGPASTVAARFAQATASTTAHRAVNVAAAAFAAYAVVFVAFATAASPSLRDFPQGAASFFAVQVAAVSLVIAAVRSLRWRGEVAVPKVELAAIARGVCVASFALVAAAGGEAAVALSRPAGVIAWSEGRWLTVAFAAAVVVMLASVLALARVAAQASAVDGLPTGRGRGGAAALLVADLDALAQRAHLPGAVRRAAVALLGHPWETTLLAAAAAFVAVTAAGVVQAIGSVAGAIMLGGVESSAIVAAFLALSRILGLREAPAKKTST
jgi:hypothetical protein